MTVTPPRTGKPGRPKAPYKVPAPDLRYATVVKTRRKGRVVKVDFRAVFGSEVSVRAALMTSPVSRAINTAFVERENGTDRHRNARKGRRTYRFSKDWRYHKAVTVPSLYCDNFCRPVRTPASKGDEGRGIKRSPAMAAGLTGGPVGAVRKGSVGHGAGLPSLESGSLPDLKGSGAALPTTGR